MSENEWKTSILPVEGNVTADSGADWVDDFLTIFDRFVANLGGNKAEGWRRFCNQAWLKLSEEDKKVAMEGVLARPGLDQVIKDIVKEFKCTVVTF